MKSGTERFDSPLRARARLFWSLQCVASSGRALFVWHLAGSDCYFNHLYDSAHPHIVHVTPLRPRSRRSPKRSPKRSRSRSRRGNSLSMPSTSEVEVATTTTEAKFQLQVLKLTGREKMAGALTVRPPWLRMRRRRALREEIAFQPKANRKLF